MVSTPVVYAAEIQLPPSYLMDYNASIEYWAAMYGAPADEMKAVINCESGFDPNAVGDHHHSFGVAQIYLPVHPFITKAQALDPDWSVQYMASHWHTDHWSCAAILGYRDG